MYGYGGVQEPPVVKGGPMTETAVVAFTTFFATIGPIDVAAMFAAMTTGATPESRRSMALRGTLVATVILVPFALVGEFLFIFDGIAGSGLLKG